MSKNILSMHQFPLLNAGAEYADLYMLRPNKFYIQCNRTVQSPRSMTTKLLPEKHKDNQTSICTSRCMKQITVNARSIFILYDS